VPLGDEPYVEPRDMRKIRKKKKSMRSMGT
jgi:hypothetical protein